MHSYTSKLIILRGNSGSGKSTIAKELRNAALAKGASKIAIIEQDYLRRFILKEKESEGVTNIELIRTTTEFVLSHGYDVILEGILSAPRYKSMLLQLTSQCLDHFIYYFDVSFEETLKRHATKPNAYEFGEKEMRSWWRDLDLLGLPGEKIVNEKCTIDETVEKLLQETKLATSFKS